MDDVQRTDCNFPLIDLTNDNALNRQHITQYFDLTRSEDKDASHIPELIDLTEDNDQHFSSNIPVINLTGDNDQFLNYRVPLINLTDEDAQDIHRTQYVDLTYDEASSSNHAIQNFNLRGIGDKNTDLNTKLIDFTDGVDKHFNPNKPVIDLTCGNNQFLNNRIQDIDMADDADVQDVTHLLQNFELTCGKQRKINDCIPRIDLRNDGYQSIDRIESVTDLTSDEDCNNDIRPVVDRIRNDKCVRKSVNDVDMNDLSYNNSLTSIQKDIVENNLKISATSFNYNATENDFLKCNKTSNTNLIQDHTFSSLSKFHHRKEILANHPIKNNFEEKSLSSENSDKISQKIASDFLEPAHHPIPLRHSLGRSTVTTSQNVPFEWLEASEDQFRTSTVFSIMRRKKSKSSHDISRHNQENSSEPSTSRENLISFEAFKEFFRKFWIFLLIAFIGLYYWF